MGSGKSQAELDDAGTAKRDVGVFGVLEGPVEAAVAAGLGPDVEKLHDQGFRPQDVSSLVVPVAGPAGDFGRGTVRRVEGGWQYIDGSVWPSLAALRDALVRS